MNMATTQLPRIAIASGDPAGIGPEISLKAALDAEVKRMCRPLVVGDPMVLETHARAARVAMQLHVVTAPRAADWTSDAVNLLAVPMPGRAEVKFATNDAAYGRAALASCSRAIQAALDGDVEAVVAAPQNQTSIAAANIPFDGHPTFVAGSRCLEIRYKKCSAGGISGAARTNCNIWSLSLNGRQSI